MSDPALVVFKDRDTISPIIYLHGNGCEVPKMLLKLAALMRDRRNDAQYAAARFCGIAHTHYVSCYGLGLFNTDAEVQQAIRDSDALVLGNMSHGGPGFVVVDCANFSWQTYDGYLGSGQALPPETD